MSKISSLFNKIIKIIEFSETRLKSRDTLINSFDSFSFGRNYKNFDTNEFR